MKWKLTEMKGGKDSSTITMRDNNSHSVIDKTTR